MCFSPQRRTLFRHPNFKKCSEPHMFCTCSLANVLRATAACNFSTSELQKVLRTRHVLYIFTCKCASCYSGVQFFDIRTSKSAPNRTCFVHFHLQMRFFATAASNFSTPELQKVLRTRHVLYIFTCKCAFRHRGVQFLISLLSTYIFAPAALTGLLFDWPDTRIIEKTQHFATSLTFGADVSSFFWLSRYCIFFLLTWLLYSAFQLSILSEVRLLNFLRLFQYYSGSQSAIKFNSSTLQSPP